MANLIVHGAGSVSLETSAGVVRNLLNFEEAELQVKADRQIVEALRPNGPSQIIGSYEGREELKLTVKVNEIYDDVLELALNNTIAASATEAGGAGMSEEGIVPASSTYTITPGFTFVATTDWVRYKTSRKYLTRVTDGTEVAGTSYSVTGNVLKFAAGDASAEVEYGGKESITARVIGGTTKTSLGDMELRMANVRADGKKIKLIIPRVVPVTNLALAFSGKHAIIPLEFIAMLKTGQKNTYKIAIEA